MCQIQFDGCRGGVGLPYWCTHGALSGEKLLFVAALEICPIENPEGSPKPTVSKHSNCAPLLLRRDVNNRAVRLRELAPRLT